MPITASYDTLFGMNSAGVATTNRPNNFSATLMETFANSEFCWHCGWITFLSFSCWFNDMKEAMTSPDFPKNKVVIDWRSIYMHDGQRDSPCVERIRISYLTTEENSKERTMTFSKSIGIPCNLSAIGIEAHSLVAETKSLDWISNELYAGRVRPAMVDDQLIKRWKRHCLEDHGGTCDQTFMTHRVENLRFVDVFDKCIVHFAPDTVTWTALSYCWGGPQHHALQRKNLEEYSLPGSLVDDILPQGIIDAMAVTRALDERYIWIDSLCILQDDDKDKLDMIAAMGTIYAHAVVTIVNAANRKVTQGIPGVSIPRRMQQIHRMKDFWLVEALDIPCSSGLQGYLHETAWNSRGWTFQEGLLSRRCLIISTDQVYWQCKTSSWCEDSCWEGTKAEEFYRHYSGSNILSKLTDYTEENWMKIYRSILEAYSKRELTSESDRLGAVQAILDVLSRDDEEAYFWGMPKGHMEMALSWTLHKSRNNRRECDAKFMDPEKGIQSAPFPSWSWIGWHGFTPMPSVDRALLGGRLGLKFYRISHDAVPEALVEKPFVGPERDFSKKGYMKYEDLHDQIGYPRGLTHLFFNYDKRSVSHTDIPQCVLSSRRAASLLCFWTSTAVLRMKYEGWSNYHHCPRISLAHGSISFYSAWENDDAYKPNGEGKFIVIGTERTRMSHGGDVTVNLLLVNQDEEGISHRRRLVTYTPEKVWQSLENRRWELVFLA
jgi:hypothetical protein